MKASRWRYTTANAPGEVQGRYLLVLDGAEVGMVSMLDQVQHQPQLMQQVVDALNSTNTTGATDG